MAFTDRLDTNDRYKLVEALLECDCMKTTADRDQVVADLPQHIRAKIKRSQGNKSDVNGIVLACLDFAGGIESLFECVKFYEEETSQSWGRLQIAWQEILANARSVEQLDHIGQKLAEALQVSSGAAAPNLLQAVKNDVEAEMRLSGQTVDRRRYLDEVMHLINFIKVQDFLDYGDKPYTQDGFAALCVIQQSEAFGGEWCLKRIRSWLETGGKPAKYIPISPISNEVLDELMIRSRLAKEFGLAQPHGALPGAEAIIQKICGSFHQDRRILINIRHCDEFQDETWTWMTNDFWRCFIREFQQSKIRLRVRVVVVLMTDLQIASPVFKAHCCDSTVYHPEKITRLPLDHWTKSELLNWLCDHWGDNRTDAQLEELAEKVYQASNGGMPLLIYSLLKKRLTMEAI
jgi:hypothetical protein